MQAVSEDAAETNARPSWRGHLVAVTVLLAVGLFFWIHVWGSGHPDSVLTCNCGDPTEQIWWLEWLPWALGHGHNPFVTTEIWSRLGGVNAMSNTSWFFPALILAPVTELWGPVASFNLSNLLAPILSGWAAWALGRRLGIRPTYAILAGLIFAYSPFYLRNTVLGHLDLTLTAYLPLVIYLGVRWHERSLSPRAVGLWVGVLTVLEYFTSLEFLAISAVAILALAIALLVLRRDLVSGRLSELGIVVGWCGALVVPLLAYPTWVFLEGPQHLTGPYWQQKATSFFSIINPGSKDFAPSRKFSAVGYRGDRGPGTDYLGAGILAIGFLGAWLARRRRIVLALGILTIAMWLLACLPPSLWTWAPVISGIEVHRFAAVIALSAGLLAAIGLQELADLLKSRSHFSGATRRVTVASVAVIALLPTVVTYAVPFKVSNLIVPAWYREAATHVPTGTAVLAIPFDYMLETAPMAWQAEEGIPFALVGGWALVPGEHGSHDEILSPPHGVIAALRLLNDSPGCFSTSTVDRRLVRRTLKRWRPLEIVLVPRFAPPGAESVLAATLGRSPQNVDGALVWTLPRGASLGPLGSLDLHLVCHFPKWLRHETPSLEQP